MNIGCDKISMRCSQFIVFTILFCALFFLASHTPASAVGFRMWERNVTTSSLDTWLPISNQATAVVVDGEYIYIAGQD